MIIKSMSRKSVSFGQLLEYMNKGDAKKHPALLHNLKVPDDDPRQIEKELLDNYRYARDRKNGVVLYHEVLSFSEKDREGVTLKILEDLGRYYLDRRAPNALAYAKAHLETGNPHLHILVTGNEIESRKKVRLSRSEFGKIKRELEAYQREKYPELSHSLCQTVSRKPEGVHRTPGENERQRRIKRPNEKDRIFEVVNPILSRSESREDFIKDLEASGFRFYTRGKNHGVQDAATGRKYRFKTLGLDQRFVAVQNQWKQLSVRSRELESIRTEKAVHRLKEMSFGEDILEVLHADPEDDPEFRSLRQRKRMRRREVRERRL
jgi:hypothetical protein